MTPKEAEIVASMIEEAEKVLKKTYNRSTSKFIAPIDYYLCPQLNDLYRTTGKYNNTTHALAVEFVKTELGNEYTFHNFRSKVVGSYSNEESVKWHQDMMQDKFRWIEYLVKKLRTQDESLSFKF